MPDHVMDQLPSPQGQFVDLHMMKPVQYGLLTMSTSCMVRSVMYPLMHSTILQQAQRGKQKIYGSLWDVFQREGFFFGVYRGVSFRVFGQTQGSFMYLFTYEAILELLDKDNKNDWHSFIAGACAPILPQTIQTPFEIINQHVVLLSKKATTPQEASILKGLQAFRIPKEIRHSTSWWRLERAVIQEIYRTKGLHGFWRSFYFALPYYCFSSGLAWYFFRKYSKWINILFPGLKHQQFLPNKTRMLINTMSGIGTSVSVTMVTNPLHILKTRSQLDHVNIRAAFLNIYHNEGLKAFFSKGLAARLGYSVPFTFCVILGYENLKEFSVKKEYESIVKW